MTHVYLNYHLNILNLSMTLGSELWNITCVTCRVYLEYFFQVIEFCPTKSGDGKCLEICTSPHHPTIGDMDILEHLHPFTLVMFLQQLPWIICKTAANCCNSAPHSPPGDGPLRFPRFISAHIFAEIRVCRDELWDLTWTAQSRDN